MNTYKCIFYNEDNERKILKVNLESEEDVINYATKNKFKIAIVQAVRYPFDYDKNTQRCKKSYNLCLS